MHAIICRCTGFSESEAIARPVSVVWSREVFLPQRYCTVDRARSSGGRAFGYLRMRSKLGGGGGHEQPRMPNVTTQCACIHKICAIPKLAQLYSYVVLNMDDPVEAAAVSCDSLRKLDPGGYDLNFHDPPDDLVCMVCHLVAQEAQQTMCCGKVFCRLCIEALQQRLGTYRCPNCRKDAPRVFADIRSDRHIKQLNISCENKVAGCSWAGVMEEYERHKQKCEFVEISCPNWCTEKVMRKFLAEHLEKTCPQRKMECPVCHNMVPHEDLSGHHNTCPSIQVTCTNDGCSETVYRGQLDAHHSVCHKHIIKCPYAEAGCSVQILREDLMTHLKNSIELHCQTATNLVSKLKHELDCVQKEFKLMNGKLESARVPPVTFKISEFHELKSERKIWKSPFFFSHQWGYKLQLHVNPNNSSSEGYLSAFLYIASGPNDDHLVWPFNGTIRVQLLNQSQNSQHHSKEIRWINATESASMKPSVGSVNLTGLGFRQFISHSELEAQEHDDDEDDCEFVKDDTVYVRISRVNVSSKCKPWLICTP